MKQREIKFRAWDKDKNVFIPTDVWAIITNDFMALGVMIKDWENYKEGEYLYDNSQSVMQFTGLLDKNGKEIYEGDILERSSSDGKGNVMGRVYFDEGQFRIAWQPKEKGWNNTLYVHLDGCYLIGNIYENPELITPSTTNKTT